MCRVESSSGESDSSASSRESVSSGGSDMIIIERTMAGMYKVLDGWIKEVLPVLPDQSLQESLLHLLQEQDDVLIEGLLCLLDTHMALYIPGKKEPETVGLEYFHFTFHITGQVDKNYFQKCKKVFCSRKCLLSRV